MNRLFASLTLVLGLVSTLTAQRITGHFPNPNLESIYPPGAQAGSTVEVRLAGRDLAGGSRLQFSHPGIQATEVKTKKGWSIGRFAVTVDADVPPGTYEARVNGDHGLSTPRAFVVGTRNEMIESEPNDAWEQAQQVDLETTVNAVANRNTDLDRFRFEASEGQRVLIRAVAESIDSPMEIVLQLRDDQRKIVAVDHDTVQRDGLIDFTPPHDGAYTLEVRDLVHDGSAHHVYRLTMTTGAHIDFVTPSVLHRDQTQTVTVFGRNLPNGKVANGVVLDGMPLEQQQITITPEMIRSSQRERIDAIVQQRRGYYATAPRDTNEPLILPLPSELADAGPAIVTLSDAPVVAEENENDRAEDAQDVSLPVSISGQFFPTGDRDYFRFEASKGDVIDIDVVAQRMGIAADPILVVKQLQPDGSFKELGAVDDQPLHGYDRNNGGFQNVGRFAFNSRTDDPAHRFYTPEDGTYVVMVRELNHLHYGDPRLTYRLTMRPARKDFRVVATPHTPVDLAPNFREFYPWTPTLARGGSTRIDLQAFRWGGFKGNIRVDVEGLPDDVSFVPVEFDRSESFVPLTLIADADAKPWSGSIRIVAEAEIDGQTVTCEATPATILWQGRTQREGPRSRQMSTMPLSVTDKPATLMVQATAEPLKVKPGEKIKLPVQVVRGNGFAAPVLITNIGLPRGVVTAKPVTIPAKSQSTEVELTIKSNAKPGISTFCLDAKIDIPDPTAAKAKKAKSVALLVSSTPVRIEVQKP